jgi:hypothetical protein
MILDKDFDNFVGNYNITNFHDILVDINSKYGYFVTISDHTEYTDEI